MRKVLLLALLVGAFSCTDSGSETTGTPPDPRPNILLAIADDATYLHLGAYGCDWIQTPAFDRVAREGLLFNRAYTPNAKCAPSRASLLTGRNSWELGAAANHWPYFPDEFTTYVEALLANGYHTGHTAKGFAPGKVGTRNGQPRELTGKAYNDRQTEPPTAAINGNDYAANFNDFLDARPAGTPFCFWYGSTEPHRSYEFGSGQRIGGLNPAAIDSVFSYWPDVDSVRQDLLDYAFELQYFDRHLDRMLAELTARGELENTIVIVTADNGMPFPRVKGQAYEHSNHMPLAIRWGREIVNPGRVVDDFVSFIDLAPTILAAAGIDSAQAAMAPITGRSLLPLFRSAQAGQIDPSRDHVLIGKERHDVGRPGDVGYPIRGIVTDSFLYVRNYHPERWPAGNPETGYLNTDGGATKSYILALNRQQSAPNRYWQLNFGMRPAEELYRIASDPNGMNNLVDLPAYQAVKNRLERRLREGLYEQGDPRVIGTGSAFEAFPYADEKHRNFYERFMAGEIPAAAAGWVNESDFER